MDYIGKVYSCYEHENFDAFLLHVGVPSEHIETVLSAPTTEKLDMDGDSYILTTVGVDGKNEHTFESGVEFEETLSNSDTPLKITVTVEGNTVTQTITSDEKGITTLVREYNGDELVVTTTVDGWDGIARRFFKVTSE